MIPARGHGSNLIRELGVPNRIAAGRIGQENLAGRAP